MKLRIENYLQQKPLWPRSGNCIMAQYDEKKVIVYQAYRPAIGKFACENQRFGGEFSFSRMSWIKPNFLWMMYRSGWATKVDQDVILAISLKREFFESILLNAVESSYHPDRFASRESWKEAIGSSDVRLQWDPDHDPFGDKLERRAIQLGLRNQYLNSFNDEGIVEIEDISGFVTKQRQLVANSSLHQLTLPIERVYTPLSDTIYTAIGLDRIDKEELTHD